MLVGAVSSARNCSRPVVFSPACCLQVDVEGHEASVLRSAKQLLLQVSSSAAQRVPAWWFSRQLQERTELCSARRGLASAWGGSLATEATARMAFSRLPTCPLLGRPAA